MISLGRRSAGSCDQRRLDVPVQGGAGLGRLVPVDQEGDPARQVGVLQADQGRVAAVQVLDGAGGVGVDPAGAGDGDHAPAPPAGRRRSAPARARRARPARRASRPSAARRRPGSAPGGRRVAPWKARSFGRAGRSRPRSCARTRPGSPTAPATAGLPETAGVVGATTPGVGGGVDGREAAVGPVEEPVERRRRGSRPRPATRNTAAVTAWATRRGSRRASSLSSSRIP